MNPTHAGTDAALRQEIKQFIVTQLRLKDVAPTDIRDEESLLEGSLGLDSIDFLELTVAMEKHYGIKLTDADRIREVFTSVASIADHVARHRAGAPRA